MKLTKNSLKKVLTAAAGTLPNEIACGDCFDQINQFAEMQLQDQSSEEALPLVKDHLKRCNDCQKEYEALLKALKTFSLKYFWEVLHEIHLNN